MTGAAPQTPPREVASIDALRVVPRAEWNELVARLGGDDAYLRRGWNDASVHLEPGAPVAVLLHHVQGGGAELALPLLVRALPDGDGLDATSAYGYGGPVATGTIDLDAFGDALDAWARANDIVATFLRFHPILANQALCPPRAELVELGSTVAWDVSAARGELLPLMHTHHRRAVRKADKAGVEMRITVAPTDLTAFRAMYDHTMRRQEAAAFYFFDDAYWDAMVADCGGTLVLVEALLEDAPVAAQLCIARGGWLHYHLGASADVARNIGASNRGFLAAAEWAQAQGLSGFHLGGGVGGGTESPLFVFKHRYDPESEPRAFHVAKLVHDSGRYRELAGTDSTAGYFPPWRALG